MADFKRYERNIILKEVGIEGQKKLYNSKVFVAGAGGLGSNAISALSSLGVGNISVADFDNVEITNLNRQFIHEYKNIGMPKTESAKEWIKNYNPDINIKTYNVKLESDNIFDMLRGSHLVIDCLDSFESKLMLNEACVKANKILIHGGVSEFIGQVITIVPKKSTCLRCLIENTQGVVPKGILSPVVSTVASIQATEAVKILLNIGKPLVNELLSYSALTSDFRKIKVERNKRCPVCGE